MPYKQLQRISQLDKQINDLRARLAEYYRERELILTDTSTIQPAAPPTKKSASMRPSNPATLYKQIKSVWQTVDVEIPSYDFLKKRLTEVLKLKNSLQKADSDHDGKLQIIAVPPYGSLDRLLKDSAFPYQYVFDDEIIINHINPSLDWELIILPSVDFRIPVTSLNESLEKHPYLHEELNYHGLGIREAIAAEVHGAEVIQENGWTLLLKDTAMTGHIPCVTKRNGKIIFDTEDAHYLLGENFMQPTIKERR